MKPTSQKRGIRSRADGESLQKMQVLRLRCASLRMTMLGWGYVLGPQCVGLVSVLG
jgi:hypothetical protein